MNATATQYAPTNGLSDAIKSYVSAKLNGTPEWALFLRWRTDGSRIYVQSASGSTLAVVDFAGNAIRMSDRLSAAQSGGATFPLPADWHAGFEGFDRTGARV